MSTRHQHRTLTLALIAANCTAQDLLDDDSCLIWQHATKGANGIPVARHAGKLANLRRLVWSLSHDGQEPDATLRAHLTCGHKGCLRPAHIQMLSVQALHQLAAKSGRYSMPAHNIKRAEGRRRSAATKLDHAKAAAIRAAKGQITAKNLAIQYGVSLGLINQIWQGVAWAPVRGTQLASVWALGGAA